MKSRKVFVVAAATAVAALIMAVGAVAPAGFGADHLDAPGLEAQTTRDADINDVYAFHGSNASRTVLAVTTHPAAGLIGTKDYATNVKYKIAVDRNGDAVEDLTYIARFAARTGASAPQQYWITRYTGKNARTLAHGVVLGSGWTDGAAYPLKGSGKVFAGLRADPFFFDLDAFKAAVLGAVNGRTGFCDQPGSSGVDFFEVLNTNAIVIEVPDDALGGNIGVWAQTIGPSGLIDQMGRPAINTVFNHTTADKVAFNHTLPKDQFASPFADNVIGTLMALGGYSQAQATGLAHVLLPDVLTYDTGSNAGFLNGRAPADDVIDAELGLVTNGGIPSDCVGPHAYLGTFPYLNVPHA